MVFSCYNAEYTSRGPTAFVSESGVTRIELKKDYLPEGFSIVENIGKGMYITKFKGNYFLTQVIVPYSSTTAVVDFTPINYKGE